MAEGNAVEAETQWFIQFPQAGSPAPGDPFGGCIDINDMGVRCDSQQWQMW
jgi:hypothetical protein